MRGLLIAAALVAAVQTHGAENTELLTEQEILRLRMAAQNLVTAYCPTASNNEEAYKCEAEKTNLTFAFLSCHIAFEGRDDVYRCYETLSEIFFETHPPLEE